MSDFVLTQEHLDKWIAALRSGEYEQIHGCFTDEDDILEMCIKAKPKHCCLDVAAIVCGIPRLEGFTYIAGELIDDILSTPVTNTCVDLNDSQHKSFEEIANYLEQTYKVQDGRIIYK